MTLSEYKQLDEMEQAELLWEHQGIEFREDGEFKYVLYQIEAFYVELRYHIQNNVLTGIRAFDSTDELEPYLAVQEMDDDDVVAMLLPKRYTIVELTTEALRHIPDETVKEIKSQPQKKLIEYHFSLGTFLRNKLNLWHRIVVDDEGNRVDADDVSFKIIERIWQQ